jgi:hypothetical protein
MVFQVGVWRSLVAHTLGVRVVGRSNRLTPTNSKLHADKASLNTLVQLRRTRSSPDCGPFCGPSFSKEVFFQGIQCSYRIAPSLRPYVRVAVEHPLTLSVRPVGE